MRLTHVRCRLKTPVIFQTNDIDTYPFSSLALQRTLAKITSSGSGSSSRTDARISFLLSFSLLKFVSGSFLRVIPCLRVQQRPEAPPKGCGCNWPRAQSPPDPVRVCPCTKRGCVCLGVGNRDEGRKMTKERSVSLIPITHTLLLFSSHVIY